MTAAQRPRIPDWIEAVAIGASAGGVEALLQLLPALPSGFDAAVLVVLHRAPASHELGSLAEVLQRHCAMPVRDAWDRQSLVAGEVTLAPANYHLMVDPGPVAALSVDEPVLWSRPALDPLFESAAAVYGPRLLVVVLTGASADGSTGAQTARRAGGLVWVQTPSQARAPAMPQAALDRAGADAIVSLDDLAWALRNKGRSEP